MSLGNKRHFLCEISCELQDISLQNHWKYK